MNRKLRFLEISVIASGAHFSLAKTFLQSYQGIWRNLSARILLESEFYLYFYYPSNFLIRKVMGGMGSSPCHDYIWTRREIYNIFLEFFRGYKSKAFSLLFEDFIVEKIWCLYRLSNPRKQSLLVYRKCPMSLLMSVKNIFVQIFKNMIYFI